MWFNMWLRQAHICWQLWWITYLPSGYLFGRCYFQGLTTTPRSTVHAVLSLLQFILAENIKIAVQRLLTSQSSGRNAALNVDVKGCGSVIKSCDLPSVIYKKSMDKKAQKKRKRTSVKLKWLFYRQIVIQQHKHSLHSTFSSLRICCFWSILGFMTVGLKNKANVTVEFGKLINLWLDKSLDAALQESPRVWYHGGLEAEDAHHLIATSDSPYPHAYSNKGKMPRQKNSPRVTGLHWSAHSLRCDFISTKDRPAMW